MASVARPGSPGFVGARPFTEDPSRKDGRQAFPGHAGSRDAEGEKNRQTHADAGPQTIASAEATDRWANRTRAIQIIIGFHPEQDSGATRPDAKRKKRAVRANNTPAPELGSLRSIAIACLKKAEP